MSSFRLHVLRKRQLDRRAVAPARFYKRDYGGEGAIRMVGYMVVWIKVV